MKVFIRGKGEVNLSQKDFIAKGGEGEVYGQGRTIYKVYLDPSKMISPAKIQELAVLDRKNILRPKHTILDKKNRPIGFTMDWLRKTVPLCKLFTNDFRNRNGVNEAMALELITNMKETIEFIHQHGCLIVDGNEFNYLVSEKGFTSPYFIDVDSYQTKSFPATAIMMSIKDWHSSKFSALSDWFSFGIVACQLLVGIHPFKGKHPKFKKNDLEARMKANVSIFNPKVRVPPAARDFGLIPPYYKDWFVELFEKGDRTPPPAQAGRIDLTQVKIKVITSTDSFEIKMVREYDNPLVWFSSIMGMKIAATRGRGKGTKKVQGRIYIDRADYKVTAGTDIIFTDRTLSPILVKIENDETKFKALSGELAGIETLKAENKMIIDNTLYIKNGSKLLEIHAADFSDKVMLSVKHQWGIEPLSSEIFAGMLYQSVLGRPYFVIPQPRKDKASSCIIMWRPELEGYKVVNAKHDNGVVIVIGYKKGKYTRFIFKLNSSTNTVFECRQVEDVENNINFVTLANGLVVSIIDDGEMEMFWNRIDRPDVQIIQDPGIDSSMFLCKDGTDVLFFQGQKLYQLKMRAKK